MFCLTYLPQPPLSDFVDLFWFEDGYKPAHPKESVLPTGTMTLVIDLNVRDFSVCGVHSKPFIIDAVERSPIIGVHFKPGGAFPFFKLPANQLHNAVLSLETLWGASAASLRDRLLEAETPEAKFRLLEQALLAQVTRPLARHPAVSLALKEFQNVPCPRQISDITGQIGLSQRRFIQLFSEEVGLTPKLFCRVQRFQEVIRLLAREQQIDWAEIALHCGYFDQAHFIHDFQSFSGLTPTAYLAQRCWRLNHLPLYD